MVKGVFRLTVVTTLLIWIGAAVFQWRHLDKDTWLLERHISPFLGGEMGNLLLTENSWPVFAATPKFLALSDSGKVDAASGFYEEHVRPLEKLYFVGHDDALKRWFLETSRLSLNDAPIRYFTDEWNKTAYRDFDIPGIVIAPRLSYVFFGENVLVITPIITVAFLFLVILATLLVRWVYRGFVKPA